jgi:hypothetical protein
MGPPWQITIAKYNDAINDAIYLPGKFLDE